MGLNDVIKEMPDDPYGHLVGSLSKSCVAAPVIAELRLDRARPRRELRFDVVVSVRGARVRCHSFSLEGKLFMEVPKEGEAASPPADDSALTLIERQAKQELWEEKLIAAILDFFRENFGNRSIDDFPRFHESCAGLKNFPC